MTEIKKHKKDEESKKPDNFNVLTEDIIKYIFSYNACDPFTLSCCCKKFKELLDGFRENDNYKKIITDVNEEFKKVDNYAKVGVYFRDLIRGKSQSINAAARIGNKHLIDYLIRKGVTNMNGGLEGAIEGNFPELIQFFKQKGGLISDPSNINITATGKCATVTGVKIDMKKLESNPYAQKAAEAALEEFENTNLSVTGYCVNVNGIVFD